MFIVVTNILYYFQCSLNEQNLRTYTVIINLLSLLLGKCCYTTVLHCTTLHFNELWEKLKDLCWFHLLPSLTVIFPFLLLLHSLLFLVAGIALSKIIKFIVCMYYVNKAYAQWSLYYLLVWSMLLGLSKVTTCYTHTHTQYTRYSFILLL